MAVTFKELSTIAELHYGKLPEAFKKQASGFFDELDQDGDGMVTLQEILSSDLEAKFGEEFLQHVFYSLDEEGKGHLDFREYLTLYYLCIYSARTCTTCGRNIPQGLGYTCLKCLKDKEPPANNPYTLCLECFSAHNYQHEHAATHILHDFVLFDNLLHTRLSSTPSVPPPAPVRAVEQTMKQCIECGDFHESRAKGFMCDVHMSKKRDSTEFVCEWCFSYFCSKCGNLFRDSTTRAEPGKWLQRFICPGCSQKNVPGDCYDASLQRLQRVLSGANLLKHCRTCEIKQRNGTMFWITNGTNMAQPKVDQPYSRNAAMEQVRQQAQPSTYSRPGGEGSGHGGGMGRGWGHEGSVGGAGGWSRGAVSGGGSRFERAGSGGGDSDSSNDSSSGGGLYRGPRNTGRGAAASSPSVFNMQDLAAATRMAGRVINVASRAANMLNGGTNSGDDGSGGGGGDGMDPLADFINGGNVGGDGGDGGDGSSWYG